MKKVLLVTGGCGFIGFHLSLRLKKLNEDLFVVDNFNDYYDVSLKEKRREILQNAGITVIPGDICDKGLIKNILSTKSISHVVNFAAQAGVRTPKINAYMHSNINGFVNILESCKEVDPKIKIVFASSSSVYGTNKKIPFSESDHTETPSSFYGATKKCNEVIAYSYHHLYNMNITGLRYFTVYGPFGRPDMSYFLFTQKILKEEKITLFNFGNMKRDFTYIDDIIDGTIASLDIPNFEIFNLGNNAPIPILEMISYLETLLEKKAIIELVPPKPEEVPITYADINKSKKMLNFAPKIAINEGLKNFVNWYKEYYSC